nr:hypothetical protein [Tanacetum cinerariifolium]
MYSVGKRFKLLDDANILLRTPRQHNMYSIDLNNIVPHRDLTCLVAKASADECTLWHRWLVTNDFSRFKWTFFLKSKDETSGILKKFIIEIENLKDLKVKINRCDNGGEFRNKEMNDFCSQKGIKKEFSNARTPQQNGVAKRRNRTLIEAARTMVLVNKFHNKTPYELFNGKSHAIGFLKPFGCYVMILNTLDNLGKFKEKGDEGIKDAASQEVKKNVSSLRYIALPNWAHNALLEFSSSKPQDHCSTKVPEGSGNLNLTASTSYPPADQMETLTVETPIPTVSSPVPTAYSTDSQEPSRDARLISKRVANQVETPSLDNILSLTNRFEDILGVITNSDESNGVKADISNIEIAITASPTPTLRIHKDHSKSQIIGPMDTPIQTKNKSKEVEEQSFIATIHQKTDPALLQFCLFSCFLSQVEPKKIFDALQDPSWDPESPAKVYKMEKPMGTIDQTLFIRRQRGDFILVQVYVDDIIFGSSNLQLCIEFEALMHEKFQMSVMGDILKKFGYSDVRSSNTPMDKENPWGKDMTRKDVDLYLYRSMIGSLMYLTASTPDIMHQVIPKECHPHAVKRIFRYLKGHPKLGLWYPKESPFDLVAYSDSDYGGATQDRKSTTGGCQFLGRRKRVRKSFTPKPVAHRPYRPSQRPVKINMNGARPYRTSFNKHAHSYANRPLHRTSAVRSPHRAPWVPTVNTNFPPVNRKFSPGSRNFPAVNRKFPTGSTKCSTADMGMKGKAVKPLACWIWKPSQNLSNKGPKNNSVSIMFKKYTYIDTQGRLKTLEFYNESDNKCIEILKKKLETLKEEKDGVDGKLAGFLKASKDLDNLIESQRSDKIKDGLGYSVVPPPPAQLYLSPKKDLS